MKCLILALIAATGCGVYSTNPSYFEGSWPQLNFNLAAVCNGRVMLVDWIGGINLQAGTSADLQYTSIAGCAFKFNISGATASLSNEPVDCASGQTQISFTSYELSTRDGSTLTFDGGGTATVSGTMCSFAFNGTGTR